MTFLNFNTYRSIRVVFLRLFIQFISATKQRLVISGLGCWELINRLVMIAVNTEVK